MLKRADFDPLIKKYMISKDGFFIQEKNDNGDFVDATEKVYSSLLSKGVLFDDSWQMLKLYFYFEYFVSPSKNKSTTAQNVQGALTFKKISGITKKVYKSSFWVLPSFSGNRKLYNDIVLQKGSERIWAKGGEYVKQSNINEDIDPEYGIYRPTHLFAKGSPTARYNWIFGYYPLEGDNEGMIRFYFNVKSENFALPRLLQNIQKLFDLYEIPFKLKFLGNDKGNDRADPMVLYVERKYPFVVFFLIKAIWDASTDLLKDAVPMFVEQLCKGLGFAEDPVNSDSFGMFACELLTDALIFAKGEKDDQKRGDLVQQYITEKRHMKIDEIYRTGSQDYDYKELFKIFASHPTSVQTNYKPIYIRPIDEADLFGEPGIKRTRFLFAAVRIALRLCKEAYWSPPTKPNLIGVSWECNWLSFKNEANILRNDESNPSSDDSDLNLIENVAIPKIDDQISLKASYRACSNDEKSLITAFLRTITQFYGSEIITKTMSHSNSGAGFRYTEKMLYSWPDEKLNQAWEILFNIGPDGKDQDDDKKLIDIDSIGDYLIQHYVIAGRPFGNCFVNLSNEQNEYFCPTLTHGLAGIGYFFLFLYDKSIQLPFKLNNPI